MRSAITQGRDGIPAWEVGGEGMESRDLAVHAVERARAPEGRRVRHGENTMPGFNPDVGWGQRLNWGGAATFGRRKREDGE